MQANEFVKKFGWDEVKRILGLTNYAEWADHYNIKYDSIGTAGTKFSKELCENNEKFVCLHDLKSLAESWELVCKHGGLDRAEDDIKFAHRFSMDKIFGTPLEQLKQAIADVESC